MDRLNKIRNKVMHLVREFPTIEDFKFVVDFFDDDFSAVVGTMANKFENGYFNK